MGFELLLVEQVAAFLCLAVVLHLHAQLVQQSPFLDQRHRLDLTHSQVQILQPLNLQQVPSIVHQRVLEVFALGVHSDEVVGRFEDDAQD